MPVDGDLQRYTELALVDGDTAYVLRKTDTPNGSGGTTITYPSTGTWFKCRIRPQRGPGEVLQAAQMQGFIPYTLDYPRCVDTQPGNTEVPIIAGLVSGTGVYFTNEDKIQIGSITYIVKSVSDLGTGYPAQQATLWRKQ